MSSNLQDLFKSYTCPDKGADKFRMKHITVKVDNTDKKLGSNPNTFNADNIKAYNRSKGRHGYNTGEDATVYEEVLDEGAMLNAAIKAAKATWQGARNFFSKPAGVDVVKPGSPAWKASEAAKVARKTATPSIGVTSPNVPKVVSRAATPMKEVPSGLAKIAGQSKNVSAAAGSGVVGKEVPQDVNTLPSIPHSKINSKPSNSLKFRLIPSNHINPHNTPEPAKNKPIKQPLSAHCIPSGAVASMV